MMTAEKIDYFKESMQAAYIAVPGAIPHTATQNNTDFFKTLEKSTSAHTSETSFQEKSHGEKVMAPDNGISQRNDEQRLEGEKTREHKESSDRAKRDGENASKSTTDKSKEKLDEKPVDQEQKNKSDNKSDDKTDNKTDSQTDNKSNNTAIDSGETPKVRKGAGTDERAAALKEILKQHRVQMQRIDEMKEDIKENFSEGKAINPTHTAEKLMLKKLGDEQEALPKTGKVKQGKGEESSSDKKMLKEIETAQKDDAATLQKTETKVDKTVKTTDNPAISLTNDGSKTQPLLTDAKINKIPTPQTLLEQYQGLKDKINQNVENSIKFMLANGENRISLKLYPPELGRVEVELSIKDNKISAKINTENVAVKEVIQSNLDQLKSNLQNAGTTIHKMDVEVGGFKNQFDQNFSNGTSDGSGRRGSSGGGENGSSKDPNEPTPGKIVNHKAQSYFLGRSINVII